MKKLDNVKRDHEKRISELQRRQVKREGERERGGG